MMDLLLQLLANGLVNGTFYALSALGLTLIFGLMRVVNFAHGEMYVFGGLLGWVLTGVVGLDFFTSLAVVVLGMGLAGWLIDRVLVSRIRDQDEEAGLLLMIGLSIFLANSALLIFGTAPRRVLSPFPTKPFFLGPVVVTQSRLFVVALCAALIVAAHLLIQKTVLGQAMRATFQDAMAARLAGIRTEGILRAYVRPRDGARRRRRNLAGLDLRRRTDQWRSHQPQGVRRGHPRRPWQLRRRHHRWLDSRCD